MNIVVQFEFLLFLAIPFFTLWSIWYLVHLVQDSVRPPILLVLLTAEAIVVFLSSLYLGALVINTRYLGNTNAPELLPITIAVIIAPMTMINIIAFVLWRQNGGSKQKEKKSEVGGKQRKRRSTD